MKLTESIGIKRRVRKTAAGPDVGAGPAPAVNPDLLPISPDYPTRTKDKVAIVGFADGHRHLAPFKDPEFEIWGLNRLHAVQEGRWDRWFEIHDVGLYLGEKTENQGQVDAQHLEFFRTFPGPIYLRPQDIGRVLCPSAQPYPIHAVLRDFPDYFNNSISWMLALAIAMRFKEIHIYGVDMAQDQLFSAEYRQQRPSVELFLGIAMGRGIKIYKPPGCDILLCDHRYGFDDGSPMMLKRLSRLQELGKRKDPIRKKIAELDAQKAAMETQYWQQKLELTALIASLDGAQQQVNYEMINLTAPPEQAPPTTIGG